MLVRESVAEGLFENCGKLAGITLHTGVTSIGASAFKGCSFLTSVSLPNGLTYIGGDAFYGCAAEIVWGDAPSITSIEERAFRNYKGTTLSLPDTVSSIASYAFAVCIFTAFSIPSGVTTIQGYTFAHCNKLVSVTIPSTVTTIKECAFYNCSDLTDIYYNGTEEEWANVTKQETGDAWNHGCGTYTVHFEDSNVK